MLKKVVICTGGVETLTFFARRTGDYMVSQGISVFYLDISRVGDQLHSLKKFMKSGNTAMFTFNFIGLSGEEGCYDEQSGYIWDQYDIPCFCMIVDHPLYYTERMLDLPKRYYQWEIDAQHSSWMKRYEPDIDDLGFLPLAGTILQGPDLWSDMRDRPVDICFTGNYTDPSEYETYITRINRDYENFYRGMIEELLTHPERSLEQVIRPRCEAEMGELTPRQWQAAFHSLTFIDLTVRFTERRDAVLALVNAGLDVDLYGTGWEKLRPEKEHSRHMHIHGSLDSAGCLEVYQNSRISLNVLPWFREGPHDRVYNSIFAGAVSLSDRNHYLQSEFQDEKSILFYSLTDWTEIADKAREFLSHPERLNEIRAHAWEISKDRDTWECRADKIISDMKSRMD